MERGSKITREEQIEQHAKSYTLAVFGELDDFSDVTDAYIEGAKWADEHPNKDYDKLVSKGFMNIEKVCEWLSDNMKNYAAFDSDMIKDLKKAMEE